MSLMGGRAKWIHGDKTDSAARTPTQGTGGTSASETVSCWRDPEPPRTGHGRVFRRPQDPAPAQRAVDPSQAKDSPTKSSQVPEPRVRGKEATGRT